MAAVGRQPSLQTSKQSERPKPPVTQLEFHQAMSDFKTMFPEMDEDVIEVVLRANNGAVDATIDQLLSMATDNENEKLRAELDATENDELPPSYSPATPPPSYHQAVPYAQSPGRLSSLSSLHLGRKLTSASPLMRHAQLANQRLTPPSHHQPSLIVPRTLPPVRKEDTASSQPQKRWNPPLLGPLPSSFLRLDDKQHKNRKGKFMTVMSSAMLQKRMQENESRRRNTISADDPELAQYLEDERIALFLQNEEFLRELMGNQEFLSTLENDTTTSTSGSMPSQGRPSQSLRRKAVLSDEADASRSVEHSELPHSLSSDETDAAFRERLKHMGKLSRRKFAQLASIFSRRKRPFKPILGDGINPSRDNLLLREDEYSELSEDSSDNDMNKSGSWNSHHGDHIDKSTLKSIHKNNHS